MMGYFDMQTSLILCLYIKDIQDCSCCVWKQHSMGSSVCRMIDNRTRAFCRNPKEQTSKSVSTLGNLQWETLNIWESRKEISQGRWFYRKTATGELPRGLPLKTCKKIKPTVYEDEWLAIREIAGIFKFLFVTFQTNFTPNHSMQGASEKEQHSIKVWKDLHQQARDYPTFMIISVIRIGCTATAQRTNSSLLSEAWPRACSSFSLTQGCCALKICPQGQTVNTMFYFSAHNFSPDILPLPQNVTKVEGLGF